MQPRSPSEAPPASILLILVVTFLAPTFPGATHAFHLDFPAILLQETESDFRPTFKRPMRLSGLAAFHNEVGKTIGTEQPHMDVEVLRRRGKQVGISIRRASPKRPQKNFARSWFVSNTARSRTFSRRCAISASCRIKKARFTE